jgi:4-carboxymuconolactone decarboxylase
MTQRITKIPSDERSEEATALIESYRLGDGGIDMNIFPVLAHHPQVAKRWMGFNGYLLGRGLLNPRARELLILRTAWRCRAGYEWGHHVLFGREAGLSEGEIRRVAGPITAVDWSPHELALLQAADELHADARIGDDTWQNLADELNEAELLEVCVLVGSYHLASFVANSAQVELEPGVPQMPTDGDD